MRCSGSWPQCSATTSTARCPWRVGRADRLGREDARRGAACGGRAVGQEAARRGPPESGRGGRRARDPGRDRRLMGPERGRNGRHGRSDPGATVPTPSGHPAGPRAGRDGRTCSEGSLRIALTGVLRPVFWAAFRPTAHRRWAAHREEPDAHDQYVARIQGGPLVALAAAAAYLSGLVSATPDGAATARPSAVCTALTATTTKPAPDRSPGGSLCRATALRIFTRSLLRLTGALPSAMPDC